MKKSSVIITLVILTLIISFVSLVNASWFEDIWNKITGRAVEENITSESVPELAPEPNQEENIICTDSDGGLNYNVKGEVTFREGAMTDTCVGDKITEWICDERGIAEDEDYACPYGCLDGACLKEAPPPTQQCADSDGGKNYYVVGSVSISAEGGPWTVPIKDSCIDKFTLEEDYCENGNMLSEKYKCTNGCEDGACIREEASKPLVQEVPPAEETKICATKITINFNKETYYYGDYLEVKVEIFDSQGNRIPNYPFYSQIYTYHDNMWHTLSGGDKTDENGYRIFKGIVEEDKMTLGKAKQKVYTKEYANCKAVEDVIEVEIRKLEKEEVCGIGVCVPEEETKEVKEIPKEKMLYSCSGCESEGKCYPMGYRKGGKYCSENYEFVEQLDEAACDNSFECKSNMCVSGECVGESLMRKIIKWFRKMFGGEEYEEDEEKGEKSEECSKLLIEKDIGEYEYGESGYGDSKESQAPLYAEDGKKLGTLKCCRAQYSYGGEHGGMAIVCPYDSRGDVENALKWLSSRGEITSGEYGGEKVYKIGEPVIVWAHKQLVIAVGGGEGSEPGMYVSLPEDIADSYLDKFPNDLGEIPEPEPFVDPAKEFLEEAEKLGEVTLIDFEALPDGTVLQRGDKVSGEEWESLGLVFEAPGEEYLKVFGILYPFNPLDKLSLSPGFGPFESGSDTDDDLTIIFSEPVKAAGIYLLDLGGTDERESITFLDENNNVIKKISPWPKSTFGNPAPGTFVYLIKDGISKIEILENTQDGDDIAYDNLYFVR